MKRKKSRELTTEEIRREFIAQVHHTINYWSELEDKEENDKLEGLAFSILSMLDGCRVGIPQFIVAPNPHPEDKKYCKRGGKNFYPTNNKRIKGDISGSLHELFYEYKPEIIETHVHDDLDEI